MEINTDGLVLRETLINDSDKLLTILTPELGKITVFAKGVKGIKSKNSPAVQLFCYSYFELLKKSDRYILKSAVQKDSFYALRDSMPAFSLASYFVDILSAICTEGTGEEDVFRLALNSLYALSNFTNKPLWQIKGAFELKVISLAGFMPDLEGCGLCGKDFSSEKTLSEENSGNTDEKMFFSLTEGSLICKSCEQEILKDEELPKGYFISEPVLYAMKYILYASQNKFLSFRLSDEYSEEFSNICEGFLICQTERDFKTLNFYKTIFIGSEVKEV